MNILNITFKDLQIFFKDRGASLQLFLLPLVFIFVFSGLGGIGQEEDRAIPLPVVNLDDGAAAGKLVEHIDTAGGVQTELMERSEAETKLEAGEINWLLTIPADFSADLAANTPVTLRLVSHPDADDTERENVRLVVDGVAQGMTLQIQILTSLEFMGEMQAANAPDQQVFTTERILAQAEGQFKSSEERPLITVEQMIPGQIGKTEEPEPLGGTQVSVPGFTVLFVFLAAGSTALSIYREKQVGSFRRLMAAPMSKAELLLGKMAPTFIVALIQVVVIFAVGMFLLPLLGLDGLTLGDHPLAVALIVCSNRRPNWWR
jgi:ABC-2 type transport system permease protein